MKKKCEKCEHRYVCVSSKETMCDLRAKMSRLQEDIETLREQKRMREQMATTDKMRGDMWDSARDYFERRNFYEKWRDSITNNNKFNV